MIDILVTHARAVSAEMFSDAEHSIVEGVRELSDSVSRSYKEMTAAVDKHFAIALEHLRLGPEESRSQAAGR